MAPMKKPGSFSNLELQVSHLVFMSEKPKLKTTLRTLNIFPRPQLGQLLLSAEMMLLNIVCYIFIQN